MADEILFARHGALWAQVDGPNTKPEMIACVDVDALAEPGGGIDTIVRCFRVDGQGWNTIGATLTPPDPVTTTFTALVTAAQSALERIRNCPATFFITQAPTGRKDTFTNYARVWILADAYINDRGGENLTMRETDGESTMTFAVTAFPPLYRVFKKTTSRVSVGLGAAANAIALLNDVRCATGSSQAQAAGKVMFVAGDTPTGSPSGTADVYYTEDYGQTWTAASADPFAANEIIGAITVFPMGANTRRVIVARGTTDAANPIEIAYSDDDGTTWTQVNVGSVNGQFVQGHNGLFALDQGNIWLAADDGYIYYSEDGGVTWEAQEEGVATTADLYAIHFADSKVGYAAGATGDIVKTTDGGASWSATTTDIGVSTNINAVFTINAQKAWVGTANGRLYYTENGGETWTRRSFSGDGVGQVRDIRFINELIGVAIHNNASPVARILVTHDGGYTWEAVQTVTNAGLSQLAIVDENNFYAAGEPISGTAALVKVQPQA